jgi:transcriptional regulator with XRE-family HTH domain
MVGKPIAITPALVAKVKALREYGLTLKQVALRLGIAESSAHKILRRGR